MKKGMILIIICFCFIFLFCAPSKDDNSFHIAIIEFNDSPMNSQTEAGIIKALEETGFIKDSSIKYTINNAHGDFPTIISIVQKAIHDNVDCICCISTPCLQNSINLTKKIPIVFAGVANPFLAGAGEDTVNHLPNVTGIATRSPFKETFDLIKKLLPETKVIGTLYSPSELNSEYYMKTQKEFAREYGITTEVIAVNSTNEINNAIESLVTKDIDIIYQISDNLTNLGFETIVQKADKKKIPLFCNQSTEVKRGAAIGLGWDFEEVGYQAGKMILLVKNGTKPADIPIQFMKGSKISINLNGAEQQGLFVPKDVLEQAADVF